MLAPFVCQQGNKSRKLKDSVRVLDNPIIRHLEFGFEVHQYKSSYKNHLCTHFPNEKGLSLCWDNKELSELKHQFMTWLS